jgi:Spy/CpxP family protein refolding chaperone
VGYKAFGTLALIAGVLSVTATAHAQRPPMPRPGMGAADSMQMRQRMQPSQLNPGHPASRLLRMREPLGLTDAQVERLEAMRQAPLPTMSESAMLRARADLMDATRGDGNPEAARAALDRMHRLRADQQVAMLRLRKEARDVLTAPQKTRVEQIERFTRRGAPGMRGGQPRARGMAPAMRQQMQQQMRQQMRAPAVRRGEQAPRPGRAPAPGAQFRRDPVV